MEKTKNSLEGSQENVRMEDLYDPKKVDLDYAILIIKPELMLSEEKVGRVKEILASNGFEIKFSKEKELTKAEIHNIYYKHVDQPYFKKIMAYAQSGISMIALLTNAEHSPIPKLKELLGGPDPAVEKTRNPGSLRALFGTDLVRNEFFSSDSQREADREREVFFFPKPQVAPEFRFQVQKITLEQILKFLMPPNLEHPNINSRLDLFGAFGPIKNHHSIDVCLCRACRKFGLKYLEELGVRKLEEKKQQLGITTKSFHDTLDKSLRNIATSLTNISKQKEDPKLKMAPVRLLDEEGIQNIWSDLCLKCQEHCSSFVHLVGGRHGQHILTDSEIEKMAEEINRRDILEVLRADKGDGAKVMIQDLKLELPAAIAYNKEMVQILFRDLETDFFGRIEFRRLQNLIMEDRRVRINAWVAIILSKNISKMPFNKKYVGFFEESQKRDPSHVNFTLERTVPLTYIHSKEKHVEVPVQFPASIADKQRLYRNEESIVQEKLLHRYSTHVLSVDNLNDKNFARSIRVLRDYNQGRNGAWDNYSALKKDPKLLGKFN